MYDAVVTLFNFHEATGAWHTTVFNGVNLLETKAETATRDSGRTNGDTVELILHTDSGKIAQAVGADGETASVQYVGPKAYSALDDPQGYFTFKAETDFVVVGNHGQTTPVIDDEYDEGLYHAMNNEYDGVYMITAAAFFGLLPHFEIGGR